MRRLATTALLAGTLTALFSAPSALAATSYGSAGEFGPGFYFESGKLAVDDASGNVLLLDSSNHRVQVYDSGGPAAAPRLRRRRARRAQRHRGGSERW